MYCLQLHAQVVQVVGHALQQATAKEHKLVVASGGGSALCRVNFCLRHNTAYRPHEVYAAVGIDDKVRVRPGCRPGCILQISIYVV
jgi:hypothetical protein